MTDSLRVSVVSKHGPLWEGRASSVTIPATDGRLGILAGRQPLLAVLAAGVVDIQSSGQDPVKVTVDSGFTSVDSDVVTVVTQGGTLVA